MSNKKITVVDYGMGNLFSICRAFEKIGAMVTVTKSSADLENAERLVLPGVGAFGDGMRELSARGYTDAILNFIKKERPMLGICLGMQMLATKSSEFGDFTGLKLISGQVERLDFSSTDPKKLEIDKKIQSNSSEVKIPAIGWAEIIEPRENAWNNSPIANVNSNKDTLYFVHSYEFRTSSDLHAIAQYKYGGRLITAAVAKGLIYGVQFHPEKSGEIGLNILRQFIELERK